MVSFHFPSRALLLVFIFVPSIISFTPPSHQIVRHLQWNSHASSKRNRVAYQSGRGVVVDVTYQKSLLFNANDDESKNDVTTPSSTPSSDGTDANDEAREAGRLVGRKIGFGILSIFGSALQLASWLISAGLVLNIFGYGYQVDREAQYGVKFDTLKNMRQDNQMRKEFERMGRQSPDPLRSLQKQQQASEASERGKLD